MKLRNLKQLYANEKNKVGIIMVGKMEDQKPPMHLDKS
jgi:hypothetical protein